MGLLRKLVERWTRIRLRSHGARVRIPRSTRLLRRFSVTFLAPVDKREYVTVGEECLLNGSITFESSAGRVKIGNRTYIGNGTSIISRDSISIGDDVTMAWGITIYDHNSHSFDWRKRAVVVRHFYEHYGTPDCFSNIDWTDVRSAPIVIGDRVWIGFNAVILKGVTVGEGAIIGACSVVSRDVAPYTVVAGNPAVLVRAVPEFPAATPADASD
jgi:acetyltransferase-like isoleucine patch superfamily enzyme